MTRTIKQLSLNVAANITYDVPDTGSFLVMWALDDKIFSASYRWNGSTLTAYNGEAGCFEDAEITTDEYYGHGDLLRLVSGDVPYGDSTVFVGIVSLEISE